ncbi:MAG: IPT/TIG domain-containing protein [Bryobacteraceae bacterium]
MRLLALLPLLLLTRVAAQAQTVINLVTDAASYAPRVAPGELASIFGSNLANSTQEAAGFPLPTNMAGATVYVNQSPVPLLYVSQTQINFQVPSGLAAGTASMYVTRSGGQSALFQFTVVSSAPGIFQDTSNHAIAQNPDYSTNSSTNPVASGAVVVVYLTGQGALNNAVPDGTATPNSPLSSATATATATIGGTNATVQFLGLTPGFTGLAQANIVVPALAKADYPLVITVGGYVSVSAQVSVSGSGTAPPTFLTLVGQLSFANGSASSVAIFGNTTYLCGPNRINIIDTSDVTLPSYVGEFGDTELAGNGGKCAINTSTSEPILVDIVGPGTAPTLAVYNIASPGNPALAAQLSTTPYTFLTDISFLGTVGYFSTSWFNTSGNSISAQHGNFIDFDFNSLFPVLLSALSSGPASSGASVMPNALALATVTGAPATAYITSTTSSGASTTGIAALDVVNISSPQNMQGIEQVTVSNAAIFLGFGYDESLLLVTGNTSSFRNPGVPDFSITGNLTLSTMNIGNVQNPVGIANVTTQIPTTGTYVVQPLETASQTSGSDIFAIVNDPPSTDPAGPSSLWIVDATTPASPVLYPFTTQFGMTDVATASGYLLVPNVNGLMIYSIQAP